MGTPESGPTARSGLAIICPQTLPDSHEAVSSNHGPDDPQRPQESAASAAAALSVTPTAPIDVPSIPGLPSLQIRTDLPNIRPTSSHRDSDPLASISLSSGSLPQRTPSLRALVAPALSSAGSLSPASIMSSPQLNAMGDITPLPSPLGGAVPWRRGDLPSLSRTSSTASRSNSSLRLSDSSQMLGPPVMTSRSRNNKSYNGLDNPAQESPSRVRRDSHTKHHSRNRSLSDYAPPGRMSIPRPVAVSGAGPSIAPSSSTDSKSTGLHREQYLAVHRGIALPNVRPPVLPAAVEAGMVIATRSWSFTTLHPSPSRRKYTRSSRFALNKPGCTARSEFWAKARSVRSISLRE